MRIGIDARVLYLPVLKGIGVYLHNLLTSLGKIDKKNEYILYYDSRQDAVRRVTRLSNFVEKGIEIRKGDSFHLWEQIRLPIEIKKDKIDIFHSPANTTMFFRNSPTVVTVHDTISQEVAKNRIWDRLYFDKLQPTILRDNIKIMTPSVYSKNRIVEVMNVHATNINVIANGIDETFKRVDDKNGIKNIKTKYGINGSYILNVGGESPWKNVSFLIKAYAKLANEDKIKEQLVITGIRNEKILAQHLKNVSKLGMEGKVVILGYVPAEDLVCLYSGAMVFVYPSLNEGFGFPPLEAMACGTPVVASNSASIPEVVGDAAFLIDAGKPENIADGIKTVIRDGELRGRLIAAGLERCKNFNWRNVAQKTLDLYEKAVQY
jgi:hypothetical protein